MKIDQYNEFLKYELELNEEYKSLDKEKDNLEKNKNIKLKECDEYISEIKEKIEKETERKINEIKLESQNLIKTLENVKLRFRSEINNLGNQNGIELNRFQDGQSLNEIKEFIKKTDATNNKVKEKIALLNKYQIDCQFEPSKLTGIGILKYSPNNILESLK